MPRRRLAVALLVPEPVASEVDVLRRAMGVHDIDRLAPHVTLVPPVNLHAPELDEALDLIRAAAAATRPIASALGPPTTFGVGSTVAYLAVEAAGEVAELRQQLFVPPLSRPVSRPFVPHVTLRDDVAPAAMAATLSALAGYSADVVFERVTVLELVAFEAERRVWRAIHDEPFAPRRAIGLGGLALTVTSHAVVPSAAAALLPGAPWRPAGDPLVLVAERDGEVVGAARAWSRAGVVGLDDVVVSPHARREGVGRHLVEALGSEAAERGADVLVAWVVPGSPADALLRGAGWTPDRDAGGSRPSLTPRDEQRLCRLLGHR